jgi:putative sterol carrier protein
VPIFPSEAWCRAAIALMEADPELPAASAGWKGDFCLVVLPDAHLREPFAIHLRPSGKRIGEFRVLDDVEEAEELGAAYVARAPHAVWKGLLLGTIDPVEALLRRQVQVQGDVQPLIERARFKGIIDRVLAQLDTQFLDGAKPAQAEGKP